MSATKTLITADELLQTPDDGYRYELVKGELRQMAPAGGEHGVTAMKVSIPLGFYVEEKDLGVVCAAETGFQIASNPDTVRAPDLAFVSKARIPHSGIPKGYWPFAPDLAVEVISPNDRYTEVEEKVLEWLEAGTKAVIVMNPRNRTVTVYNSLTEVAVLKQSDVLTLGDVVPGFSCPISKLFV
jgi:Uma2 family endonuclease